MNIRSIQKFSAIATSIGLSAWACLPTVASAQEAAGDWALQVTPYVWMAGIGGKIRPIAASPTVQMDTAFSEVLEDLTAAAFVSGLAKRDRLILLGDLSYSSLSKSGNVVPGLELVGKERQTSVTFEGGYRALDGPDLAIDFLAGLRVWDIRVSVQTPALGLGTSRSVSVVDPVVAVRFNKALAPRWSAIVYGDVGGFGVGSKSTWQVVGTINYNVESNFYVSAGYRYLALDYDKKGTLIDVSMSGPLLGLTWRF